MSATDERRRDLVPTTTIGAARMTHRTWTNGHVPDDDDEQAWTL